METNTFKPVILSAIKAYFKTLPKDEKLSILTELVYYFNVDETSDLIAVLEVYDSEEEYNATCL